MCSTSSYDADEIRRADEVCRREEARWEECRHLFIYDDDGELIGLANDEVSDRRAHGNENKTGANGGSLH